MPKKSRKGTIAGVVILVILAVVIAYSVAYKLSKDKVIDSNTTTETTVENTIPSDEDKTDFTVEAETYEDYFADANIVEITDETDLKLVCLNRFNACTDDKTNESMLQELKEGSNVWLWTEAADAFEEMYAAAEKAGVTLTPIEGFCGFERQDRRYTEMIEKLTASGMKKGEATGEASKYVLPSGHSEQYLGLIVCIGEKDEAFKETEEYTWLRNHAEEYGFIERYPSAKETVTYMYYQPYTWRYVGVENAKAIVEANQCLEEFVR